jgi:NADH:ubiquinone oxidoreductase subunit C
MSSYIYFICFKRLINFKFKLNFFKINNYLFLFNLLLNKSLTSIIVKNSAIILNINNENFINIFSILKYFFNFNFSQLLDIIIVDRMEMKVFNNKRFNFTYVLLSIFFNFRLYICGFCSVFEMLPSLFSLYKSADWLEREIWDMFGIFFSNHLNLRRILTDYGFVGFPLRKDFPLSGYFELRYDEINKIILLEPLELMQEFRFFKLEMPWRK